MKNQIADGRTWTGVAPYALLAGEGCLIGSLFGVAVNDCLIGGQVVLQITGSYNLVKNSGEVWTDGLILYWDDTAREVTLTSTSNTRIGLAYGAAASLAVVGGVMLKVAP